MADMYLTRRAEEALESALESETLADDLAPGGAQFPTDGEPRARSGRQLQTVSCMHARKSSCKLSARGSRRQAWKRRRSSRWTCGSSEQQRRVPERSHGGVWAGGVHCMGQSLIC